VKHYLRGEDGIHYADLYHLVKFLPSYALPSNIPSRVDLADAATDSDDDAGEIAEEGLPEPATARTLSSRTLSGSFDKRRYECEGLDEKREEGRREGVKKEPELLPAYNLPRFHILDIWPLSVFVRVLMNRGKDIKARFLSAITAGWCVDVWRRLGGPRRDCKPGMFGRLPRTTSRWRSRLTS
jgi:ion channel-forming bestrophin family protein